MSVEIIFYLIFGLSYVTLEHDMFDFSFEDLSRKESIIAVMQQSLHYIRVMLVFPLYAAEDMLIWFDNRTIK